jgi:large subunit ribosomal protein L17
MRKNYFGRQLKRDANERKALFKGLMTQLVMHERIQTTEQKAKAIKGSVEKLVTKAKIKGAAAQPLLLAYLHKDAVDKMINDVAPRFVNRPGGYTRILRIGRRFQDDASSVIIEWVERPVVVAKSKTKGQKTKTVQAGAETEQVAAEADIVEGTSKETTLLKKLTAKKGTKQKSDTTTKEKTKQKKAVKKPAKKETK